MQKVGIILPDLSISQSTYAAIKQINFMMMNQAGINFNLFYENVHPPCIKPLCSIMNLSEIWTFDGLLISTNIRNTLSAQQSVTAANKVFYVNDLDWLRPQNSKDFMSNIKAFRDPNIKVIAKSKSHAKAIESYGNRKVDSIIPHFNLGAIIDEFYR